MVHKNIRTATIEDIPDLIVLRGSVDENRLSDPAKVSFEDYKRLIDCSEIWVWEEHQRVLGFSAARVLDGSIWALFVDPDHEGRGIGRSLLNCACDTLKQAGIAEATLRTEGGTRAARFYERAGWTEFGRTADGEVIFRLRLGTAREPSLTHAETRISSERVVTFASVRIGDQDESG